MPRPAAMCESTRASAMLKRSAIPESERVLRRFDCVRFMRLSSGEGFYVPSIHHSRGCLEESPTGDGVGHKESHLLDQRVDLGQILRAHLRVGAALQSPEPVAFGAARGRGAEHVQGPWI